MFSRLVPFHILPELHLHPEQLAFSLLAAAGVVLLTRSLMRRLLLNR